jgi:hypothetical protein
VSAPTDGRAPLHRPDRPRVRDRLRADLREVAALYAKGSQALGASPKNAGDHVERMDATSLYLVGDTLESQHTLDVRVTA